MRAVIATVLAAFAVLANLPAHAETTLERIKKDGVVRIGFANEAPWSFAKSDGTIAGADYELAQLVFGRVGFPIWKGLSLSLAL